jgi:hypothetical protein
MPMRLIYQLLRRLLDRNKKGESGMIEEVLGGDRPKICVRSTLLALDRDPKACALFPMT